MNPNCKTCGGETNKVFGEIATCLDESCPDLHIYDCRDGSYCEIKEADVNHPDLK